MVHQLTVSGIKHRERGGSPGKQNWPRRSLQSDASLFPWCLFWQGLGGSKWTWNWQRWVMEGGRCHLASVCTACSGVEQGAALGALMTHGAGAGEW